MIDGGPSFDLVEFNATPLTCSYDDADWNMNLPPIADADTQQVTIELLSVSEADLFYIEGD